VSTLKIEGVCVLFRETSGEVSVISLVLMKCKSLRELDVQENEIDDHK
jgi:hypothetical protein